MRVSFNYLKPKIKHLKNPRISHTQQKWNQAFKTINIYSEGNFTFLNKTYRFDELGWDSFSVPKLWMYNLHYFDYLLKNKKNNIDHMYYIDHWISNNSSESIGWESYPTSLRIVNWIKFTLIGNSLSKTALDSLYTQAHWLSQRIEYHLEGNHLFANGKALIFSGLFFNSYEGTDLKKLGIKIINAEIKKQVLNDGGHFELSPMYHALIIEDILDIIQLDRIYPGSLDKPFIKALKKIVSKMILWLKFMSHPDDSLSFFNDSVNKISRSYKEIEDYAAFLNISLQDDNTNIKYLDNSGYFVYVSNNYKMIIDLADVGPDFQPGHGHADALSFEASVIERKFIVNLGISAYQGQALRSIERGTESHSTIEIDGINSSDVWGEFRVGRRAKVYNQEVSVESEFIKIAASHNGYKHLKGSPVHHRKFFLYEKKFVVVDNLYGRGQHSAKALFHLHPDTKIIEVCDSSITLSHHGLIINFESNLIKYFSIEKFQYSPEFGIKIPTKSLVLEDSFTLPYEIKSSFTW